MCVSTHVSGSPTHSMNSVGESDKVDDQVQVRPVGMSEAEAAQYRISGSLDYLAIALAISFAIIHWLLVDNYN